MDEEMKRRVENFLIEQDRSLETISEDEKRTLFAVDAEIQKRLAAIDKAEKEILANRITVQSICHAVKMPRSSVYYKHKKGAAYDDSNKALIPRYIERFSRKKNEQGTWRTKYDSLLTKYKIKEEELKRRNEEIIPTADLEAKLIDKDMRITELETELNSYRKLYSRKGGPQDSTNTKYNS